MTADRWGVGEVYEPYMGRWSRVMAAQFVPLLAVPRESDWVDVGCGTGAVSSTVLDLARPRTVLGVDPSAGYVEHARNAIADRRFSARVGSATDLGLAEGTVDAVVSGLVLNFVPLPVTALEEARRVVRPGGVVGGYVWDYAEGMGILRAFWDAALLVDPEAADAAEGVRFPLCRPGPLRHTMAAAGLEDPEVRPLEATARFESFDAFWNPFLGGEGPAGSYLRRLAAPAREFLRGRLRGRLPIAADGSIVLPLRAWAFWGHA